MNITGGAPKRVGVKRTIMKQETADGQNVNAEPSLALRSKVDLLKTKAEQFIAETGLPPVPAELQRQVRVIMNTPNWVTTQVARADAGTLERLQNAYDNGSRVASVFVRVSLASIICPDLCKLKEAHDALVSAIEFKYYAEFHDGRQFNNTALADMINDRGAELQQMAMEQEVDRRVAEALAASNQNQAMQLQ